MNPINFILNQIGTLLPPRFDPILATRNAVYFTEGRNFIILSFGEKRALLWDGYGEYF